MNHAEHRANLAAAFRWTERLGMNEGIANHYSLVVEDSPTRFLVNPAGKYWSQLRASDMVELDTEDGGAAKGKNVDPTAWAIHSALHRKVSHARCVMHLHSKYATVLSVMKDPTIPPIDQTTMRFFNRVGVDDGFDGMGLGDEAERLASAMGNRSIQILGQHGILVVGPTVGQCFEDIYYFERAAETYVTALQTGMELNIASDEVAEKTARQWEDYEGEGDRFLAAIREVLDAEEPEYAH